MVTRRSWVALCALVVACAPAFAQVPPEVEDLAFVDGETLSWLPAAGAADYNVYRGLASELARGVPPRCHGDEILGATFASPALPAPGGAFVYLVTAESADGEEGSPGSSSAGPDRALLGRCDPVMRDHVVGRLGYGQDEWTRERLATLGIAGYVEEQLTPSAIVESLDLTSRIDPITPPSTIVELISHGIFRAVYSRRQLEQQATRFWSNHFNTAYQDIIPFFIRGGRDPALSEEYGARLQFNEVEAFRELAFTGSFRDIVEASTLSPAMILYLDTDENVVGAPNENFGRELLELYTMGVDKGYTQRDVQEMARVMTGWTVCKKSDANKDDPLAPCIPRILEDLQPGEFVAHFVPAQHDPGAKRLFEGTPYQVDIPDTSAAPADGINDVQIALDAIASHPSTKEFISTKLLQRFVTDTPTPEQVGDLVAAWDASDGDLLTLLETCVEHPDFLSPDDADTKIKTPVEHMASVFRTTRGNLTIEGIQRASGFLIRMQHIPHGNVVPTGYPEVGSAWVDTNNILERQNLAFDAVTKTDPRFGTQLIAMMADEGLSAASPPDAIIDYWADRLFGGALTPAELQEGLDYLTTDDLGVPAPVSDAAIRETVAFLMGFPHFCEQ